MKSVRSVRVACVGFLFVCMSSHHAFAAASVCDSMKDQAAGKGAASHLKCHVKAAKAGTSVDPICVANARNKLFSSVTKAEDQLDCTVTGNRASLLSLADEFVKDVTPGGTTTQEVFVIEPAGDLVGIFPFPLSSFPLGIEVFTEPAIQNGVAVLLKVRDAEGDVTGFASELEAANFATAVTDTAWTLNIPGRGALFLSQQEDLAPLLVILTDMLANSELERSFDPPLELDNTIAGTGVIVGGTGEFENASGTFRELATLYAVSLIAGERPLAARLTLEVNFE